MTELPSRSARTAVAAALAEDESGQDVTTAWSVPERRESTSSRSVR
jgi:nicotinate-nucleotide pyrophosphorylase (carboxylating)